MNARIVYEIMAKDPAKYSVLDTSKIEDAIAHLLPGLILTDEQRSQVVAAVYAKRPEINEATNSIVAETITKMTGISLAGDYTYQFDDLYAAAAEVELISSGILAQSVRSAASSLFEPLFGDITEDKVNSSRTLIRQLTQDRARLTFVQLKAKRPNLNTTTTEKRDSAAR